MYGRRYDLYVHLVHVACILRDWVLIAVLDDRNVSSVGGRCVCSALLCVLVMSTT
jgi:hypothetical protein